MRITESQLRKIVREEILREGVGSTYMAARTGPAASDRAIQKYIDQLGADAVLAVFGEVEQEMGFEASMDVKRRELLSRLADMSMGR